MPDKKITFRTDLAMERAYCRDEYREYTLCNIKISELSVHEDSELQKGRYVTLHCPVMKYSSDSEKENIIKALSVVLRDFCERITGHEIDKETKILIAGLGNRFITADAVGPRCADGICVTNHMEDTDYPKISAIHPGVTGQTGIEALPMICGAAQHIKPHIIIVIDALCARAVSRLASTVQITDTGIEPGSGVGNRRSAINRETTGFPVIAIGVPTIVDSATLISDALSNAGVEEIDGLDNALSDNSFFVSMRDTDVATEEIADILSRAINRTFLP